MLPNSRETLVVGQFEKDGGGASPVLAHIASMARNPPAATLSKILMALPLLFLLGSCEDDIAKAKAQCDREYPNNSQKAADCSAKSARDIQRGWFDWVRSGMGH